MTSVLSSRLVRLMIVVIALIVATLMVLFLRVPLPAIELAAEPVIPPHFVDVFGFQFSITNTLIASWLSMIVLVVFAFLATRKMKMVPSGLQNVAEMIIEMMYNFFGNIAGDRIAKFFPWVMTIFLWVLVSNWMGLVPGFGSIGYMHQAHEGGYKAETLFQAGPVHLYSLTNEIVEPGAQDEHGHEVHGYAVVPFLRSAASDLSFTLALAFISVLMTQIFGLQALGLDYVNRFIPFKSFWDLLGGKAMKGMDLIVGPLELVSEFAKIISFSFRLFGNVFAGEVLLGVMIFLIPHIVPLPFYGLEIFVGAMQAFVFAFLTLLFMTMATTHHGEDGH
ncbi:MAG: F0F1 ATP synthase subunit A [Chloroflexi bacterium]|nr:F0F1 ATP synthase subunit A [Chloroflexota bacterium]MBU1748318.1 F0F1 ATP synthase subunit A [Chloroflexota bacterium]